MVFFKKLGQLVFGLFIFSLAIVFTIHSQLGASPWDVFHLGLKNHMNLSLGQISQLVGIIIIIGGMLLGEMPGIATIFNMYFIGVFIDIFQGYHLIPLASTTGQQFFMLFLGIYLFGWGTYFYLGAGLGSGPRDTLMVGLLKKTKHQVWKIRAFIEITVLVLGYLMGGLVGIGTILSAFLIGFAVQSVYSLMKVSPGDIKHITFVDYYQRYIKLKKASQETIEEKTSES